MPTATQKNQTGYKQTEVGVIPSDWDVKTLGELFEITSSKRVFQSEWKSEGVPFYRARELAVLSEKGYVKNELFISREMYKSYKNIYGAPKAGDMLVTGVGTLGKVYVAPENHEFYFKDGNIIWFKLSGKINSNFLKQLYSTPLVTKQIDDASGGTTVGTYTISGAKKTIIPVPSFAEQKVIATVLSDTDALVDKLDELITKKRNIKQGAMQELLICKKRLPGFNEKWEKKKISELSQFVYGEKSGGGESPYLEIGDIDVDLKKYDVSNKSKMSVVGSVKVPQGTLLISMVRPTRGAIVLAKKDIVISGAFCRLKIKNNFVFSIVNSEKFLKYLGEKSIGGTYPVCRAEDILDFEFFAPTSEAEQLEIANVFSDMDAEVEKLDSQLTKYQNIKQGMMQTLLTGKIRLPIK
ncbi:restriction endonuclease subunit S [Patescibacteria group bacterium]|nr:restriction endonuclease subunit S [Patescibacteria group bacterium]